MGPVLDGIELLLFSIPPHISSSQGDARIVQVPAGLWASWWCRGISLPVVSSTRSTTAVRTQHYKGLYLLYVYSIFSFIVYSWQWLRNYAVFSLSQLCPKEAILLPVPRFQYLDHRIPFSCSCWNWLNFYNTNCWSYSMAMLILPFILAQK